MPNNKTFLYSLRLLRRDIRAGELRVLFLAIAIAVASVTSVGFFTDRIQQTLRQQANELLAADLVVSADHPLPDAFAASATLGTLRTTDAIQFRSMALAGEQSQLTEIKAVGALYPLRGKLRLYQGAQEVDRAGAPARGEVWVEPDVLRRLQIETGARVQLGTREFAVTEVIAYEPDRGGNMFNIAPRVLMNIDDLPDTGLLQEGSRAQYQLLVAGDQKQVKKYRATIEPKLQRGERVVDVTDARQEVSVALDRAQRFLRLAALVSVLLAGVAVAMATRRHVERQLDSCAIMRCVGASQSFITRVYLTESIVLGLVASLAGCALGYVAHAALVDILGRLVVDNLSAPGPLPVVSGVLTGLITLLVFAFPPILHLRRVPTLRVLRRDMGALPAPAFSAYAVGIVAMSGLLFWQAGDVKLGAYVIGGVVGTVLALWLFAMLLVRALGLMRRGAGVSWRFGVMNVARRARSSIAQILALGVGLMALLLLTIVKGDLLRAWEGRLPADTPNRFVINIQPDQVAQIEAFFAANQLAAPSLLPMVRGRLAELNEQPVVPAMFEDERSKRLAEREFNLSWAAQLERDDNQLVAGKLWDENYGGAPQLSVEEGIARALGIGVGDRMTYNIAGDEFTAPVTSLRKVQWDSFRANFFVVASPGALEKFPASYITSFFLPPERQPVLNELLREFPNLTLIDVSAIMTKVRDIITRVTRAIEYVFIFTLLAGLMVLYAAIAATQDERLRESAMLRTLGATRGQLTSGVLAEFLVVGALAGTIAAIAASILGFFLAERLLNVPFNLNASLWLIGIVGGGLGIGLAGFLGTRATLNRPPLPTLRGLTH
jgi:putative ABC transport system permease protein